ncbi:MAG: serine/threonine protein kinase [Planctomycetota bacterium]|nr:serine/threonine protein kinase [Planctomycetota bacterium]
MPRPEADRNLLLGVLALQMDFITRDALIAAMYAWVFDKTKTLGALLLDQHAIDPADLAALEPMVARHVARHGNDPATSLASLSSTDGVVDHLRSIGDPDVDATVTILASNSADESTESFHRAPATGSGGRFRRLRDHARGGLGVVYVAHDAELNREVALKEIRQDAADNLKSRARFVTEAEITGGLEHPGIVPVYGLGKYDDGRPYYAMRFIRGDSLKEAIGKFHASEAIGRDPGERTLALQKLLRRFLDVCNAISYAHSRGILHRDLKPGNILVGQYGETLVVDWGLAKAVGRPDAHDLPAEASLRPTGSGESDETVPGSVLGTPQYMSPEQAAGRLDLLGPASDVYSLGATLFAVLTGKSPFADQHVMETLRKVQIGEFRSPRTLARWIPPALEAICLKAMALKPEARYVSPHALADDLERWLADEPVSAWREPISLRFRRWVRKNKTLVATASAAACVAIVLLGGGGLMLRAQRLRAEAGAREALEFADRREIEAGATSDLALWGEAIAAVRRAEALIDSAGGSAELRRRVDAKLAALLAREQDRRMVTTLEECRLQGASVKDGRFDLDSTHSAFLLAFRGYGIDLASLSPQTAAARIRSSPIREALLAAIDEWSIGEPKNVSAARLDAIAVAADPGSRDPQLREAVSRRDLATLSRLAGEMDPGRAPVARTLLLARPLSFLDPAAALALLEATHRANPSNFWVNHELGRVYLTTKPPQNESSVRYFTAALVLRPNSPGVYVNLGVALDAAGKSSEALDSFRRALALKPDYVEAMTDLGAALRTANDIDGAIEMYRRATALEPNLAAAHANLGIALHDKGDLAGAIDAYNRALLLNPGQPEVLTNLGVTLRLRGDTAGAIGAFHKALAVQPDLTKALLNLGIVLEETRDLAGAIDAYRRAIATDPENAEAFYNLGCIFNGRGDHREAIDTFRRLLAIKPDHARGQMNLGNALAGLGDMPKAIAALRRAIELKPDFPEAYYNLGTYQSGMGNFSGAIEAFRQAIKLKPDYAEPHCNLGLALQNQGAFAEALDQLRKGHDLGSRRGDWRYPSDQWVKICERMIEVETRLPAYIKGEAKAADFRGMLMMADVCRLKSLNAASARFFGQALDLPEGRSSPPQSGIRYNAACVAVMAAAGQGKDDPPVDGPTRDRLRLSALDWLRADLAAWGSLLKSPSPPERAEIARTLAHRKSDPDLGGIRDEAALAALPASERATLQTLWREVEDLRKTASEPARK